MGRDEGGGREGGREGGRGKEEGRGKEGGGEGGREGGGREVRAYNNLCFLIQPVQRLVCCYCSTTDKMLVSLDSGMGVQDKTSSAMTQVRGSAPSMHGKEHTNSLHNSIFVARVHKERRRVVTFLCLPSGSHCLLDSNSMVVRL